MNRDHFRSDGPELRRGRRNLPGYAAVLFGLCMMLAAADRAAAEGAATGEQLYLRYCSACHGASGRGDGVVSQAMRPRPTDLTQIAKQAGGTFRLADVAGSIDGRETARAHGDPDMPVWGETLRAPADSGSVEASGKVLLIAEYLKTILAK